MVQYYLNQTTCDVPHKFALALDETDLEFTVKGDRAFENVTLISGPIEETTTSTTGSSVRVTAFSGEGLKCGSDGRKTQRHRNGQRRVKDRNEVKPAAEAQALDDREPKVGVILGKNSPSPAAGPVNNVPGSSAARSFSPSSLNLHFSTKLIFNAAFSLLLFRVFH